MKFNELNMNKSRNVDFLSNYKINIYMYIYSHLIIGNIIFHFHKLRKKNAENPRNLISFNMKELIIKKQNKSKFSKIFHKILYVL